MTEFANGVTSLKQFQAELMSPEPAVGLDSRDSTINPNTTLFEPREASEPYTWAMGQCLEGHPPFP